MGDRANIIVKQGGDRAPVYLYTHWGGSGLPLLLQQALQRRQRWNDHPYLTRIIFCTMIGADVGGETGYGISTTPPDNEHHFLVVDPDKQTVALVDRNSPRRVLQRWSCEDFLKLKIDNRTEPEDLI